MTKDLSEYVCLDGVYVREEQVVKMAMNAGSFAVAEHYLCALLAHGLMYGKTDIINKVRVEFLSTVYRDAPLGQDEAGRRLLVRRV